MIGSDRRGGLAIAVLLIILFWGIAQAGPFLIPICLAALLALLMAPVVRALCRIRIPEGLAIGIAALLLILPLFGLGLLLFNQGQALIRDLPAIEQSTRAWMSRVAGSQLGQRFHLERFLNLAALSERLVSGAGQGMAIVIAGVGALLNAGSRLALILVFTLAMLASRRHLRRSGERILSHHTELQGVMVLDEIVGLVQRFLVARSLIVILIAIADFAILLLFKVNYAFLLGSFLGVMTLIPAIGFLIGLAPALLVTIATGHTLIQAIGLVACLIVMSIIEGNVLTPALVGRRLNINALTTFLGFFGGGLLWGVWGMFLSIPVLGVIRIVFSSLPELAPWGELLADREDHALRLRLHPGHPSPPMEQPPEEPSRESTAAWSTLPTPKQGKADERKGSKSLE